MGNYGEKSRGSMDGVMSKGYGTIPKLVMQHEGLSIEAKAIYAYLASFAGAGDTAYPSVSIMCKHLGISKDRFYRHRKSLLDNDFIRITQHQNEGGWSNNLYTVVSMPSPQNKDTQNKDTRNKDTRNKDTQNKDTINNSSINNSINNNKSKSSPEKVKEKQKKVKRSYGEFKNVKLTDEEVNKLKDRFPESYEGKINDLSFYIESKGAKYKSHYATILTWDRKDKENESVKFSPSNEKEKYGWKDQLPI